MLGFTQEKKLIPSLALGLYDADGNLHYIDHVGTGFSQANIDELYPKLLTYETTKTTAENLPNIKDLILVKPKIAVEIKYLEKTKNGTLRHTTYLHVRDDKKPKDCRFDQL